MLGYHSARLRISICFNISQYITIYSNISAEVKSFFASNFHEYPEGNLLLKIYNVNIKKINFKLIVHDKVEWVTIDEMKDYNFAPADIPIIEKIKKYKR